MSDLRAKTTTISMSDQSQRCVKKRKYDSKYKAEAHGEMKQCYYCLVKLLHFHVKMHQNTSFRTFSIIWSNFSLEAT